MKTLVVLLGRFYFLHSLTQIDWETSVQVVQAHFQIKWASQPLHSECPHAPYLSPVPLTLNPSSL
jgi:hypothetical protein